MDTHYTEATKEYNQLTFPTPAIRKSDNSKQTHSLTFLKKYFTHFRKTVVSRSNNTFVKYWMKIY